ncbi:MULTISPECIES: glycosyl transferase [unclassified Luteococcus]|uniref:glycosyl transferase n=1 Tax=unclassified Luteococcus TaxID=2639923 RepID=UPI00313B8DDF
MFDTQARRMVFHTPLPLNRQATTASGIRPVRMRDAFEELGYEVWEVTGYAKERATAARRVREALAAGTTFDFCYSESSTMPTSMTDPHHLPLHPRLDFTLLGALRAAGTPVGLFYRDIHWSLDSYGAGMNPLKKHAALAAYRYDLRAYQRCLNVLYLPSAEMAPHVPVGTLRTRALPPGHAMPAVSEPPADGVHLFYVGGLGGHYHLPKLLEAVQLVAAEGHDVSLTMCTHANQFEGQKEHYEAFLGGPVRVVHASGEELAPYYAQANTAALFVEPHDYWTFAAPVKMYEYVGQARPILASEGTLCGEVVRENGFGWTIPYTVEAAADLLRDLARHPERIREQHQQLVAHRVEHSWLQRARTVAEDLSPAEPA